MFQIHKCFTKAVFIKMKLKLKSKGENMDLNNTFIIITNNKLNNKRCRCIHRYR